MWQFRRQYVEPGAGTDTGGESSHVHVEDAGVFCSRECLRGYLAGTDQSGIFNVKRLSSS
jgi:hypothetical protein